MMDFVIPVRQSNRHFTTSEKNAILDEHEKCLEMGSKAAEAAPMRLEKPARQVMETFHFHLFTVPVVLLIAAVVQSFQAFPAGPEPFAFLRAVQPQTWGAEIFRLGLGIALPLVYLSYRSWWGRLDRADGSMDEAALEGEDILSR